MDLHSFMERSRRPSWSRCGAAIDGVGGYRLTDRACSDPDCCWVGLIGAAAGGRIPMGP